MRESSKRPRVEPSGITPPPPSSTGTTFGEASVDLVGAAAPTIPPPSTFGEVSEIHHTLEIVMTVQATHD